MGGCHSSGPNEALVISGGCFDHESKRTIVGGWGWACACVTDVQRLSMEVMTLNPQCEKVETSQGVAITVTGVAQVKVMADMQLLAIACEQFLGKSVREIEDAILQTLEGHLRAILGTLSVEEIYQDREKFAALVREVASPDVGKMGIEILSFTIKDIFDTVQYLDSLGKTQTAEVKKNAEIGVAQSQRDAGIRQAEAERERVEVRYAADAAIAKSKNEFELQKAAFDQEVNTKKAQAELAYQLQATKEQQRIREEEIQIEVIERRKLIDIEEQEIARKEKELVATVKRPAEAESFKVETIAQGKRTQTVAKAQAEAEAIKLIGAAEASAIEAKGKAEAERMRQKASAYKQYGDAAMMSLILESLPKLAAEVAAPLAKTDQMVILGSQDGVAGEITKLIGQLPPAVQALTGVDLSGALGKIPGARS
ncbi:flotillin-2-like [Corticium candelabrum]|uniref:flotillin-2-like n=1 Tax=Corticium candelabrum TaxID=121492 RepID=UPI002E273331|nr:flotillin-2-like [Corticium candelabrum]